MSNLSITTTKGGGYDIIERGDSAKEVGRIHIDSLHSFVAFLQNYAEFLGVKEKNDIPPGMIM